MTREERLQALRVNLTTWNFEVDSHFTMTREDADLLTEILLHLESGYKLCKISEVFDVCDEPPKDITNTEKFEEVFGFRPQSIVGAPNCLGIPCPQNRECRDEDCTNCQYKTFWNDTYKEGK